MRIVPWTLALAAASVFATAAAAQATKLRPGLWEHSGTMKSQSGQMEAAMAEMQKSLASMPPEQRKQMEQMMAQQGVGMTPGGGHVVRICMTQQDVDMDQLPAQEGCTQKVDRVGANTVKVAFQCKGGKGQPPSSGEGTVTIESPTAYSGKHRFKTTQENGRPEQIDMVQKGRWLGADCGQVKPFNQPRR